MFRQQLFRCLMVFVCISLSCDYGYSQSDVYQRSSISYSLVANVIPSDLKTQLHAEWRNKSKTVPTKFDLNPIPTIFLYPSEVSSGGVEQALIDQKIGNELISFWWARSENGTFSIDSVAKRGRYNATDSDVTAASASAIGDAKMYDVGEKMISKSFYLVGAIKSFSTYEEYYDNIDAQRRASARENNTTFEPVNREYRGYFGKMDALMYQLDFSDSIRTLFYENLWVSEGDSEDMIAERKAAFEEFHFPMDQVAASSNISVYGREKRNRTDRNGNPIPPSPMTTLFTKFISETKTKINGKLLANDRFNVLTTLYGVDPIQAKIGTKEGLSVDTRYFVYEYKENYQGERKRVRKAVIRAKVVTQNSSISTGNTQPSEFYMITGTPLDPGMLLEENDDKGIFISAYGGITEIGGGGIRGDLLISKFSQTGKTGLNLSGFIEGEGDEYDTPPISETSFSFTRLGLGFRKDYYFIPYVRVGVGVDGGIELADYEDNPSEEGGYAQAFFVRPNVEVGVHVWHSIQLVMNMQIHGYFSPTYANGDEIPIGWSDFFEERNGPSLFFGVRYNL